MKEITYLHNTNNMGRGIHQFRLNNRNCLTFYVYEDDFCLNTNWKSDQFVNAAHRYIQTLTYDSKSASISQQLVYTESDLFGAIHVRTDLWDLVTKIEEDYIAFTIVPDSPTRYKEKFRNNLYAQSANAFLRKIVARLPVRCYGGPWTRGILLSEEEVKNNIVHHYKPI